MRVVPCVEVALHSSENLLVTNFTSGGEGTRLSATQTLAPSTRRFLQVSVQATLMPFSVAAE